MIVCPLCKTSENKLIFTKRKSQQSYWDCENCGLIFLGTDSILSNQAEHKHYQTHDNNVEDIQYQNFVSDIVEYISTTISPATLGLDFGSGPGPVITRMLEKKGYKIKLHDPYFKCDTDAMDFTYDYIFSCEVIEHFNNPATEFLKLKSLLNMNGQLIVKTQIYEDNIDFITWYYHSDPTHIVFYRPKTLEWIKEQFKFTRLEKINNRVYVFWS